jgi:hypothetical protein
VARFWHKQKWKSKEKRSKEKVTTHKWVLVELSIIIR